MKLLLICTFGLLGVVSRHAVGGLVETRLADAVPLSTLLVNLVGSLVAGFVYVVAVERGAIPPDYRVAVMVGFFGGFTTFSAQSLEGFLLAERAELGRALLYLTASPPGGRRPSLVRRRAGSPGPLLADSLIAPRGAIHLIRPHAVLFLVAVGADAVRGAAFVAVDPTVEAEVDLRRARV